ncbi:Cof-type HAD-IIB family hydrolase [Texcoconibacillus texcoconensis]|uniref:Hydrolase n=1 Tax=Texcoconibacillus texcoconensis TaxID=1095777 RepID=A0A840QNT5_9BACI|nr:Cof-type HAD-IIB family hydrolase [Texcoconibacillus texcoconensis]MBB5173001.1 hypothetical protein [Texcoconibacillus texcoconensis]
MKLFATDMDGTLLNEHRQVSEVNTEAIRYARSKGVIVAVATGRDFTEAISPLKEVKLRLPLICANGAEIRNEQGDIVKSTPLSLEQYYELENVLQEEGVYYELYTSKGSYTNDRKRGLDVAVNVMHSTGRTTSYDEAMTLAEKRFAEGSINFVEHYHEVVQAPRVTVYKLLAFTEDDELRNRVKEKLQAISEIEVTSSASDNLEITNKQATKGISLETLAAQHQISMDDVVAIGDNFNDVSMLKKAGHAIAMENAEAEVKNIADDITETNDHDGVARAIYRLLG